MRMLVRQEAECDWQQRRQWDTHLTGVWQLQIRLRTCCLCPTPLHPASVWTALTLRQKGEQQSGMSRCSGRWIMHANVACFILTGVLLTDEALLHRGDTFVCRHSQTQHLPLAGAAFTHQKGLQVPTTATDNENKAQGRYCLRLLHTCFRRRPRWCKKHKITAIYMSFLLISIFI